MIKFDHSEEEILRARDIILDLEVSFDSNDQAFRDCLRVWTLLNNEIKRKKELKK